MAPLIDDWGLMIDNENPISNQNNHQSHSIFCSLFFGMMVAAEKVVGPGRVLVQRQFRALCTLLGEILHCHKV